MSELTDAKTKFKELKGRLPHHTWGADKIMAEIGLLSDNDEEKEEKPKVAVKEAKNLKPIHSRLFVPKVGEKPARTVLRADFNGADLEQYKEAYADRLKKAMKKLS